MPATPLAMRNSDLSALVLVAPEAQKGESPWSDVAGRIGAGVETDLGAARERLLAESAVKLVVCYPNPGSAVARAIRSGENDTGAALREWARGAHDVIELYQQNRDRVVLVDADAAIADVDALVGELAGFSATGRGPGASAVAGQNASRVSVDDNIDPIALAVAEALLRWSPECEQIVTRLTACSTPLPSPPRPSETPLLNAFRERAIVASARAAELRDEHELLLLQLKQVQEELDASYLANREIRARLLREEDKQRGIEADRRASAGLQEEMIQAKVAVAIREEEISRLRDEVMALRGSVSWRLTAPLRAAASPVLAKRKRDSAPDHPRPRSLAEARELLKDRDEELAALCRSWSWKVTAPLRAVLTPLLGPSGLQRVDTQPTARELRDLAQATELLVERERQITALRGSLSWRLTAPLRALAAAFGA